MCSTTAPEAADRSLHAAQLAEQRHQLTESPTVERAFAGLVCPPPDVAASETDDERSPA